MIDDCSSIAVQRRHAPDQEGDLAEPVEGDPASDEVSEVLDDGEGGKYDPVGEPLGVVSFTLGLQSFDGTVGGVGKPGNNIDDAPYIHHKNHVITYPIMLARS